MKLIKYPFLFIVLISVLFVNRAESQIRDSMLWFNLDPVFVGSLDGKAAFEFTEFSVSKIPTIKTSLAKSIGISAINTKYLKGPIKLKNKDKCIAVACAKGCPNCEMVWRDLNKDSKVQPKKEVRCICAKTKELCKMAVKTDSCD